MNKKIIIVIISILILVGGILIWQLLIKGSPLLWKQYSDEKLGVSIKYPWGWKAWGWRWKTDELGGVTFSPFSKKDLESNPLLPFFHIYESEKFCGDNISLEEFFEKSKDKAEALQQTLTMFSPDANIKTIPILFQEEYPTLKIETYNITPESFGLKNKREPFLTGVAYEILKENTIFSGAFRYSISEKTNYQDIFEAMIASLKFIQSPPSLISPTEVFTDETDWKTYKNGEYDFEIKYPPDWEIKEEVENEYYAYSEDFRVWFNSPHLDDPITIITMVINIHSNPYRLKVEEWYENHYWSAQYPEEWQKAMGLHILSKNSKTTDNGINICDIFFEQLSFKYREAIIRKSDRIFRIELGYPTENQPYSALANEFFQTMLSTFKFID